MKGLIKDQDSAVSNILSNLIDKVRQKYFQTWLAWLRSGFWMVRSLKILALNCCGAHLTSAHPSLSVVKLCVVTRRFRPNLPNIFLALTLKGFWDNNCLFLSDNRILQLFMAGGGPGRDGLNLGWNRDSSDI